MRGRTIVRASEESLEREKGSAHWGFGGGRERESK